MKLTVAASDDGRLLRRRLAVTRLLADINPAVVGPIGTTPDAMQIIDGWCVVCYLYIAGTKPDVSDQGHVELMAATLAGLHRSMADLGQVELPRVAALKLTDDDQLARGQLIHGDFAPANIIATPHGFKIIDFDDCGQGSVVFDVGNTLYMVLFDGWRAQRPDIYPQFRSWFVPAYRAESAIDLDDSLLDAAILLRAQALNRWLAVPDEAPAGLRNSSPEWRAKLHSFVDEILSLL